MIVVLSGRPGVGKTTCAREIIKKNPNARMLTSVTTREPRVSDLEGEYKYIRPAPFMRKKSGWHFLWSVEYPKYSQTYYGTENVDLINALGDDNHIYIMILVPDVLPTLLSFAESKNKRSNVRCFYIHAEEKIIRERLRIRGEKKERINNILAQTREWDDIARENKNIGYKIIKNEGSIEETVSEILSKL